MVIVLAGGERHERPVLPTLMERGAVKRPGRDRPRIRPDRVAGAKGCRSPTVRRDPKRRSIGGSSRPRPARPRSGLWGGRRTGSATPSRVSSTG
ncbi:MAG: hypothetical protein AVDCRST_MAG19-3531 [uncultured Thermomicrobiales bacterium]|uniref:Uncharacterized protein n=1 Tax=uncultured Thermomicrobiales bacterium TaxID=1645740 RepID=A0A6J4VM25_9BACT|nr:MAG: hypothetical protein AVDCRST_MAG19-3531 [uncultured Thermomicrobiales bacterium]